MKKEASLFIDSIAAWKMERYIEDMYGLDSQIDEKRITLIGEAYERKIELFRAFQLGQDLQKIKFAVKKYPANKKAMEDVFIPVEK